MKRVLLLVGVLLALGAEVAEGAPVTKAEVDADYAAALAWWGVSSPPLCGEVVVTLAPTEPAGLVEPGQLHAARATQPLEFRSVCTLEVYEDQTPGGCPAEMLIRHETGHLLSLGHSPDPNSIMAAQINLTTWCAPSLPAGYEDEQRLIARRQDWILYREWRAGCRREPPSPARRRCFGEVRRFAEKLRIRWV